MTKNTINQICDKLTDMADNFAEQERILRGLIAVIRSSQDDKEPKVINTLPEDKLGVIEKLIRELIEQKEGKSAHFPVSFLSIPTHISVRKSAISRDGGITSLFAIHAIAMSTQIPAYSRMAAALLVAAR